MVWFWGENSHLPWAPIAQVTGNEMIMICILRVRVKEQPKWEVGKMPYFKVESNSKAFLEGVIRALL